MIGNLRSAALSACDACWMSHDVNFIHTLLMLERFTNLHDGFLSYLLL